MWFNYSMKKRKRARMLLKVFMFLPLLVSCAPQNSGTILVPLITTKNINTENYTIPLTKMRFETFVDSARPFVLYVMSAQCLHCQKLEPRLINYVAKTKIELYKLDVLGEEYNENRTFFNEALALQGYPSFFIFKNGNIAHHELGTTNLQTNKAINDYFGTRLKRGTLHLFNGTTQLPRKKFIKISFDFSNLGAQTLFQTHFYPLINTKDYLTYLEDMGANNETMILSFYNDPLTYDLLNLDVNIAEVISAVSTHFS